jgi:DNA invertase Pin-like site-specific DNA recombinase
MTESEMRVAIYARVSTDDKGQDPENQLRQLRAWCASAGHEIVGEYVDHASGGKGADKRPELSALLADAHKRQFDLVLCWALDRLSREGMVPTVLHLQRLATYGVGFHSYTEPMLSTDNEMIRDIVLAVMASLAKIERQKISERTRAGMQRVRQHGSKSGKAIRRPRISDRARTQIVEMLAAGAGIRATARTVGTGNETVHRIARELRQGVGTMQTTG